jgi:hypothetical protein
MFQISAWWWPHGVETCTWVNYFIIFSFIVYLFTFYLFIYLERENWFVITGSNEGVLKNSVVNSSKPFTNFMSNWSLICSHVSEVCKYLITKELDWFSNYVRDGTMSWAGISYNQIPHISGTFLLVLIQQRGLPLTEFNLTVFSFHGGNNPCVSVLTHSSGNRTGCVNDGACNSSQLPERHPLSHDADCNGCRLYVYTTWRKTFIWQ